MLQDRLGCVMSSARLKCSHESLRQLVSNFSDIGKLLLVIGGGVVLLGLLILVAGRIPFLGRLPGDIFVRRGSGTFYFPVVTWLVVSIVLTIVVNVVLFLVRRH